MASTLGKKLEALGHGFFYGVILLGGLQGGYFLLAPVVFCYVACSRKIHQLTRPYVAKRFPDCGPLKRWWKTFFIVQSFGKVLVDRGWLGCKKNASFQGEFADGAKLKRLVGQGKGVVLLTAHVGNWQAALAHLTEFEVPVNSLMRYQEEAVAKHFFDHRGKAAPFKIIRSDGFLGGMVESTAALQRGEVVTIMGDRYAGGPFVKVDFLGKEMRFPAASYSLAAATGAPVAVLLAAKLDKRRYTLKLWDVFQPTMGERHNRQKDLARSAKRFAIALENYVQEYPGQWYNFFDFWEQ